MNQIAAAIGRMGRQRTLLQPLVHGGVLANVPRQPAEQPLGMPLLIHWFEARFTTQPSAATPGAN